MFRKPVLVAAAFSVALTGCVTTRDERIGANDGTDACYQYRVTLDSTGDYYAEDMVKGAVIGAVAGAAVGLLVQGNAQGALVGAAGGAALGAAGGYWQSKMQQGREQAVLAVASDAQMEAANLDRTQLALDQLTACRRAEIARVKNDYKAKRISREEGEQRMALIRQQLDHDYQLASQISTNVVKRREEFLLAADNITPGSANKIRTAKKPGKNTKPPKPSKDPAVQTIAHVTSAYQTSERIAQAPAQIQTAKVEATLEAA